MVRTNAMRTGDYICEDCDQRISICDRCGSDLEAHDDFDPDGDEICCLKGPIVDGKETRKHVVPGCKMKEAKRW